MLEMRHNASLQTDRSEEKEAVCHHLEWKRDTTSYGPILFQQKQSGFNVACYLHEEH